MNKKEEVMAVPKKVISPFLQSNGLITENLDDILAVINKNCVFVDRLYAEYERSYRQIIPYAVLVNDVYCYLTKRLPTQKEARLHGMYSIGIGGHVDLREKGSENKIVDGLRRELQEEVGIANVNVGRCIGVVNDVSSDVGNYHIGLLYVVHPTWDITIIEKEKMIGWWATEKEINKYVQLLEPWSQIVWNYRDGWFLRK